MFPGEDLAVYEIEPVPRSVGAVNTTDAVVPDIVAVPIVGAPGLRGQFPE
jgi:hypothetical protein